MSQRTLLTALAVAALLLLAGVAIVGTDSFNLFGSGSNEPVTTGRANVLDVDPFADPDEIQFDGRDEHGRYINGPGGKRIYIDESGRRYILGPDGSRIYVNEYGQPVDRSGRVLRPGEYGKTPGKFGDDTADTLPAEPPRPDEPAEEDIKPADLIGQVVDDAGKAYGGATITAQVDGSAPVSVISGDEGGFKFAGLPSEKPLTLSASDAYGNTSKPVTTKLAPGATSLKQPLVLPRDTAIRGVVRDVDTGLPIEGAQVLLLEGVTHSFSVKQSQAADAGGAFAFAKLTPMAYRLQISRDGYAPRILNSVEPPANLIVEMSPGAVITGTITDMQGNPLPGAVVSCDFNSEPAQKFHTEAVSEESGFYVVKCQPESQHNTVSVVMPGFESTKKTLVKSASENVNFYLKSTGNCVVRGRLLTKSGTPVPTASFSSYDAQGLYRKVVASVGPNTDGLFRCEVVLDASQLVIRSPGLADILAPITPTHGGDIDLGDLYFDSGYTLFGVITAEGTGAPVAGADVTVNTLQGKSDNDGKYRISGLSLEQLKIHVVHPTYAGLLRILMPQTGSFEIELNLQLKAGALDARLRVTDAETGETIAYTTVTLPGYPATFSGDAQGIAHITGLASPKVAAVVTKQGYAAVQLEVLADQPEKTATKPPQDVIMEPGATISGMCMTNGEALPGATKVEIWDTGKLVTTLLTDSEGWYHSDPLPLGQYYMGLPDYHVAARPVTLTEDMFEYHFEIGTVCHLRGKIMRADGQPHANQGVYVYRRDEVYWSATIHTGPDGKYEVMNLFPGEWVFCALKTQGDTAAQFAVSVSVTNAGWTDKNVQLPAITGVITGRVTYPGGAPVKKARVSVSNLSANFPRALLAAYVVTDDDGRYTAERLENGAQMQARVGGYQDEAQTGTAFSEVVTIPSDNAPVEADIVVAPSGVNVNVAMRRADGGPAPGGSLCYLFDDQGRMSGLYFGGGVFGGTIHLYDVVPGTYALVVTIHGMKKAELQITVGAQNITTGLEILVEPHERSSE